MNTPDTEGSVEELMRDLRHLASPYAETLSDMQRTSQFILLVNRLDKAMRTPDTSSCTSCNGWGANGGASCNTCTKNTPDTEFDSDKEVVGSDCLCVLGSKKHNPECEYATPDTEKCCENGSFKEPHKCLKCTPDTEVEIEQNAETGEVLTANGVKLTPDTEWEKELEGLYKELMSARPEKLDSASTASLFIRILDDRLPKVFTTFRSSRDTYWKERVEEAVKELLSYLPDATGRYAYAWEECDGEEQEMVKAIRAKYTPITNEDNLK